MGISRIDETHMAKLRVGILSSIISWLVILYFLFLISWFSLRMEFMILMIFWVVGWLNILTSMKRTMHWYIMILLPFLWFVIQIVVVCTNMIQTDCVVWAHGSRWCWKKQHHTHWNRAIEYLRGCIWTYSISTPQPIST